MRRVSYFSQVRAALARHLWRVRRRCRWHRRAVRCCWSARTRHRISTRYWESGCPVRRPRFPVPTDCFALNIDPEAAEKAYRDRVIGPYRGVLPEASINSMEEQLSGACTVEIAAFDEFTKLLGDAHATAGFDHIIFDTAPTGHTLRLLQLPAAWTGFIAENTTGTSCLGPLAGLDTQKSLYDSSLQALTDASTTTLVLVSRPERSSLAEANRTRAELAEMGIANQRLFLNGVFVAQDRSDAAARAL